MSDKRVTTIRADQWELVAEDVKAGRCEVFVSGKLGDWIISEILDYRPSEYLARYTENDEKGNLFCFAHSTFTVRWLAPAPASEQDAAAYAEFKAEYQAASDPGTVHVYPGVDKQGYDILSGGKLDRWKHDKGDAFEYALMLANYNIRTLQVELAATRQQVAAAGVTPTITNLRHEATDKGEYMCFFDYNGHTMATHLDQADVYAERVTGEEDTDDLIIKALLYKISKIFSLQATPQPALSDLRAAVAEELRKELGLTPSENIQDDIVKAVKELTTKVSWYIDEYGDPDVY